MAKIFRGFTKHTEKPSQNKKEAGPSEIKNDKKPVKPKEGSE